MELPPKIKEYRNLIVSKLPFYLAEIKKRKILLLPLAVVILLLFTVFLSISQSEKQKSASQNTIIDPQETIVPVPTGPSIISRAGTFKAVQVGSKTEYFIVLKNGDALKLEIPPSISVMTFYDKKVFVSGILNSESSLFKVENITRYETDSNDPEEDATPVPYPNNSPSPTPTDLPLSSPVNE